MRYGVRGSAVLVGVVVGVIRCGVGVGVGVGVIRCGDGGGAVRSWCWCRWSRLQSFWWCGVGWCWCWSS